MVVVTKEDIERGYPGSARLCPLARAAARCVPGNYDVTVTREAMTVFLGSKKGFRVIPLDEGVSERVRTFDIGGKVEPFSWELPCTLLL